MHTALERDLTFRVSNVF